jgi:hypothetical protein
MKKSSLVTGLAASVLVAFASPSSAGTENPFYIASIQGTWEVVVTLRVSAPDCKTAALVPVGPNPFPSFNTFHFGGTMNEWGTRSPPAQRGGGHGLWKRVGAFKYQYRVLFHSFDGNGLLTAKMDITSDVKLGPGGTTFEGTSRFVRTDLSGNVLNFCATLAGSRVTL